MNERCDDIGYLNGNSARGRITAYSTEGSLGTAENAFKTLMHHKR